MRGTPQIKREATDPRGSQPINECKQQEAEQRGMLGQGTTQEYGTIHAAGS